MTDRAWLEDLPEHIGPESVRDTRIQCLGSWEVHIAEPTTRCRHGSADCDRCGTTSRRDAVHMTDGGRGRVARIPR